ncbi:hypothetical protein [Halocella sp. SP3-1]|uniref:hypothetical protein n=1 Tax=Halocella sp. SP3-1 TaxID=2382161 RepID=UPI000F7603CF|nr:hypothetical protein [Halocella sp. SP3-1]AZO96085.1 hypothetical protein D7D81_16635 [Halocella sp. SP3-1]
MALAVFPDIIPPITPEDEPEDPGISTQMEDGMVISRARYTRSRLTFYLTWGEKNALPTEDKETLLDFYQNIVKGSSEMFKWTCNSKFSSYYGQTFTVRFTGSAPRFEKVTYGFWGTEITLQEV